MSHHRTARAVVRSFALATMLGGASTTAMAQAASDDTTGEIVVTAQKREQSVNKVGMSINALKGDDLVNRGVSDAQQLVKVVPGLTYQPSTQATPVYTLRGVGFFDSSLASSPAVSVYVDEAPLPYPIMTAGAALDLERVEVLKGPQGTLFGQNSTGGAINYIAAKPASTFATGADLSLNQFGQSDVSGFISGPLSDTLKARVAIRAVEGGAWQKSKSRPDDKLGDANKLQGRVLLDWQATERLKLDLNLNGFIDRSDTTAFQNYKITNNTPRDLTSSLIGNQPRVAEWTPGWPMRSNNRFGQAVLRADYELADALTLTSLTSYAYENVDLHLDADATVYQGLDDRLTGYVDSLSQELRLTGTSDRLQWLVGASYQSDHVQDNEYVSLGQSNTINFGFAESVTSVHQKIKTHAAFGNVEYKVTDALTIQAGARYTRAKRDSVSCLYAPDAGNGEGIFFTTLQQIFVSAGLKTTPVVPIGPGECVTLDPVTLSPVGPFRNGLDEDNLSWRGGISYDTGNGGLIYANYSRGWKAGTIATIGATTTSQYAPVVQERLDAVELGFKQPLFDRRLQLNGALFHYAYANKQVRGILPDPIFGPIEKTVNVPHSVIKGGEVELSARPVEGLSLSVGATYLDAKIDRTFVTDNSGSIRADYNGSPLPYTPKFQLVGDAQYERPVGRSLVGFLGGGVTHHSSDNSTFRTSTARADDYYLKAYTTVDLRVGVRAKDNSWKVALFGRNVGNTYYWNNTHQGADTIYRTPGEPATFGIVVSVRPRV